jgi:putative ABC transport system ATP-binding protein
MCVNILNLNYKIEEAGRERSILNDITYDFEPYKITTIAGSSGSGKTTLLYSLSGILEIANGKIIIDNESIYELSQSKRDKFRLENISFIYQNFNLLSFMNVEDNILLPIYLKKQRINLAIKNRLIEYLDLFGLGQIQKKSINTLSGGEQQRVAIIRSMIGDSKLILCDEPTGSLDRENTLKFMNALTEINKLKKTTIVIVTHDEEVYNFGEIKIKMLDGNILMQ